MLTVVRCDETAGGWFEVELAPDDVLEVANTAGSRQRNDRSGRSRDRIDARYFRRQSAFGLFERRAGGIAVERDAARIKRGTRLIEWPKAVTSACCGQNCFDAAFELEPINACRLVSAEVAGPASLATDY